MSKVSASAARIISKRGALSLNKHDLSEALHLYVHCAQHTFTEDHLFTQKFRDVFTKNASSLLIDAVFGVASRYGKIDGPKQEGLRRKEHGHDGLLAAHLLQKPKGTEKGDFVYPKVTLPSFGTFSLVPRAEREGMHPDPKKSERIVIPKTHVVSFKPGKSLKAASACIETDETE
ncbi:MAG: hypothetical protein CMK59_13170 [Proteobacteria bacterium]|nr:hypothetical protein [Pseudomonadota bacterium]